VAWAITASGGYCPDGGDELLRLGILKHIASCPGFQGPGDLIPAALGGEDEDLGSWTDFKNALGSLDAV
jgi:hypothetical protein